MLKDITYYWLIIASYFIIINLTAFFSMMLDKKKARKKKYRTPESVLLTIAVIGGSIGSIIGMDFFRHKTRHKKFSIGLPIILLIQVIIFVLIMIF